MCLWGSMHAQNNLERQSVATSAELLGGAVVMQGTRSLPLRGDAGKQVPAAAVVMQGDQRSSCGGRTAGGRGAAVTAAVQTYRWQAGGGDAGNTDAIATTTCGRPERSGGGGDAGKQVATAAEHDGAHELHAGATAGEHLLVKVWAVQQPAWICRLHGAPIAQSYVCCALQRRL